MELSLPLFQRGSKMIDSDINVNETDTPFPELVHLKGNVSKKLFVILEMLQEIKIRLRRNKSLDRGNSMGVVDIVNALPNPLDQLAHPSFPPIPTSTVSFSGEFPSAR